MMYVMLVLLIMYVISTIGLQIIVINILKYQNIFHTSDQVIFDNLLDEIYKQTAFVNNWFKFIYGLIACIAPKHATKRFLSELYSKILTDKIQLSPSVKAQFIQILIEIFHNF